MYFILFYVVVILVLFNLLIGAIASAYVQAAEAAFDHDQFELLATHDAAASSWNPESGFKTKAVIKDFMNAGIGFFTCRFWREKYSTKSSNTRFRKNPIMFWRCYREILLYMDSDSLKDAIVGIVSFNKLAESAEGGDDDEDEETTKIIHSTADLVHKSVLEFLDSKLGGSIRREKIFQILVAIPASSLGSYKSRYWSLVLDHHTSWHNEVQAWHKLEFSDPYEKVWDTLDQIALKERKKAPKSGEGNKVSQQS